MTLSDGHELGYATHLLRRIEDRIQPFRLGDMTIWLSPDYFFVSLTVYIESENLPNDRFSTRMNYLSFFTAEQDYIANTVASEYVQWLNALYVLPEDHIQLGEN